MAKTIRVKKSVDGPWKDVTLITAGKYGTLYMVQVEDPQGTLWLTVEHVHPEDYKRAFGDITRPLVRLPHDTNKESREKEQNEDN